jgi:hypothetical protein
LIIIFNLCFLFSLWNNYFNLVAAGVGGNIINPGEKILVYCDWGLGNVCNNIAKSYSVDGIKPHKGNGNPKPFGIGRINAHNQRHGKLKRCGE